MALRVELFDASLPASASIIRVLATSSGVVKAALIPPAWKFCTLQNNGTRLSRNQAGFTTDSLTLRTEVNRNLRCTSNQAFFWTFFRNYHQLKLAKNNSLSFSKLSLSFSKKSLSLFKRMEDFSNIPWFSLILSFVY